jgi:hypothetical protein
MPDGKKRSIIKRHYEEITDAEEQYVQIIQSTEENNIF